MSDIFISYAKEDREHVAILARALGELGWSVFWDRAVPAGLTWREFIGRELEEAHSVVVTWSEASVKSQWVLEEAEQAKKRHVLVPVLIESVEVPFGFGALQAADLSSWDGDSGASAFLSLAEAVGRVVGVAGGRREAERKSATAAQPVVGGEKAPVEHARESEQPSAECAREGGSIMSYLKEKMLPGAIAALVVAVVLGVVNVASSGGLTRLAGGAAGPSSIPANAVLAFEGTKCPRGWKRYEEGDGRVIVGLGKADELGEERFLGQTGGEETIVLTVPNLPSHRHVVFDLVYSDLQTKAEDTNVIPDDPPSDPDHSVGATGDNSGGLGTERSQTENEGGGEPHSNMQPFVALLYCIQ